MGILLLLLLLLLFWQRDKHFQTKKQGLLTQRHVTVTETLRNICVPTCGQDGSVSVVSATGWTAEESHLYSCQA